MFESIKRIFSSPDPQSEATAITDENFKELVMNSDVPVLLDFWAPWCGPCKVLGPVVNELAEENQEEALVAKVNVDQNPRLSQSFKIKSIPTIVVIHQGNVVERFSGLVPKPNLQEILNKYKH